MQACAPVRVLSFNDIVEYGEKKKKKSAWENMSERHDGNTKKITKNNFLIPIVVLSFNRRSCQVSCLITWQVRRGLGGNYSTLFMVANNLQLKIVHLNIFRNSIQGNPH